MFVHIHFPQMVFNDQDEDVGQHLHKFFATENQLALISLLNDLRSLHDSFPLRLAVPRQRLVKCLSVHSTVSTLDSKCKEVVRKLISEVYNANEIEKVYDHLWDLELYCFLNSDKNKNKYFNSFLEKIRSSRFTRIDPERSRNLFLGSKVLLLLAASQRFSKASDVLRKSTPNSYGEPALEIPKALSC